VAALIVWYVVYGCVRVGARAAVSGGPLGMPVNWGCLCFYTCALLGFISLAHILMRCVGGLCAVCGRARTPYIVS